VSRVRGLLNAPHAALLAQVEEDAALAADPRFVAAAGAEVADPLAAALTAAAAEGRALAEAREAAADAAWALKEARAAFLAESWAWVSTVRRLLGLVGPPSDAVARAVSRAFSRNFGQRFQRTVADLEVGLPMLVAQPGLGLGPGTALYDQGAALLPVGQALAARDVAVAAGSAEAVEAVNRHRTALQVLLRRVDRAWTMAGMAHPELGDRPLAALRGWHAALADGERKPEAGERTPEAGEWKPEAGEWKPEAGEWKPEAGAVGSGDPDRLRGRPVRSVAPGGSDAEGEARGGRRPAAGVGGVRRAHVELVHAARAQLVLAVGVQGVGRAGPRGPVRRGRRRACRR
jgi:hypothetical protein